MARKRHCKSIGFQKGVPGVNRGQKHGFSVEKVQTKYVRCTQDAFEARVNRHLGIFTFLDVDGSETNVRPLRPSGKVAGIIDEFRVARNNTYHPNSYTNKLYCPAKVQLMFNSEIKIHAQLNINCNGILVFDSASSQKWGLVWRERLKCEKCTYIGIYYNLYEEVERNHKGRGRQTAKANVGFQIGLFSTPISNHCATRILNCTNIIAPTISGMQKTANSVAEAFIKLNNESIKDIMQTLKADNKTIGQKDPKSVRIEGDTCYNNPLFNSESTPFQAGTMATTTLCENNTLEKKIIGVHIASKLCVRASRLRNKGEKVSCPNHAGYCSANITGETPIGQEDQWNEKAARQISQDLKITHFTGDGDSKGHKGVNKCQENTVISLKDLRHLANSMKRQVYKAPFTKTMFPCNKSNLKNRFALSVKARCLGELISAHRYYNGDMCKITLKMPKIIETIVLCFKGYCGSTCAKQSFVCTGHKSQVKYFLPQNVRLRISKLDEEILTRCINLFLGTENLGKTRFLTSTQKCEAVNRSYQAVVPKATTFARNFRGRIHGQIHKLNKGFANSVLTKCSNLHANITRGSSVVKQLVSTQRSINLSKSKQYRSKHKTCRYAGRLRKYNLHEKVHYRKGMTDPKLNTQGLAHLSDHSYV